MQVSFAQQKYTSTGDQRRMDMIKRLHFTPRNFFFFLRLTQDFMLTDYINGLDLCHFGLFYSRKRTGNKFAPHTLSDLSSKLGQLHFSALKTLQSSH